MYPIKNTLSLLIGNFMSGHRAIASNVPLPNGYKPIVLETLSKEPRVFKIYNFFTEVITKTLIFDKPNSC